MKFDRRIALHFDWFFLLITMVIVFIGLINLYSASFTSRELINTPVYLKQIYWIMIGLFAMIVCFSIDYQFFERFAYPIFVFSVILLILVIFFGKNISGSKRWIHLGIFSIQPSEFFKIALILALSKFFKKEDVFRLGTIDGIIKPILIVSLPIALILHQPDLGTSFLIILIFLSILLFNGIRMRTVIIIISSAILASIPLFIFYVKDYQKMRILTFINPNRDPLGSGYHITQSKIAIGSGNLWGKGLLKGTQNQLHFLPEQHTDFVFSVLAEEWGFMGSFIIISLYTLFILWILKIANNSRDTFGALVAFGISSLFFWHIFINIGMSIGIVPVVGAPLPFMSYGGSSTVAFFICIGLLLNISTRRFSF